MTKPIDIISRALKDIGALEAGETPTPEAAQDAFEMMNDLIDQWSNENMMVFNVTEIIFPVIPGQIQYSLGPSPQTLNFIGASFEGSIELVITKFCNFELAILSAAFPDKTP